MACTTQEFKASSHLPSLGHYTNTGFYLELFTCTHSFYRYTLYPPLNAVSRWLHGTVHRLATVSTMAVCLRFSFH